MAKATITIKCKTCGKEFTVSKNCYSRTEADSWEHWAANHYTTCHECYAQKNQPAASNNLPELEGSEKQIAWATSIRAKFEKEISNFIADLEKMLEELKASGEATPAHTAHIAKCHKVMAKMLSETSCRWWIDNRTASFLELFDAEMANTEDEPAEEAAEEVAEETAETSEEIAEENTIETQEEIKMTRAEELIQKYNFKLKMEKKGEGLVPDGTIYTMHAQQVAKDGTLDEIKALKPEMLKILMDQYNQQQQATQERLAKINAIEGLNVIQDALEDVARWQMKLEKSFDTDGGLGVGPKPKYDFEALYTKYPRAHAYLQAEKYAYSENNTKAAAGKKALERIINGEDYEQALKDMDAEWTEHFNKHLWD